MAKGKHGHHGGAWKVAYADFVTAMMALFLVLWLTAQDQKIKEAVERAFRHPFSSPNPGATGIIQTQDVQPVSGEKGKWDSSSAVELNMLRNLMQDLLRTLPANEENPLEQTVKVEPIPDGMRVSIFDRNHKPVFEDGAASFTKYGRWVFETLAWDLSRYSKFQIELEGHSEQGRQASDADYGVWELTSDYANAARRLLIQNGVQDEQMRKVAGFGATKPLPDRKGNDPSNRRVTVLIRVAKEEPSK
jgi:chemotaxis protein MotB